VRETADPIEAEGVARSRSAVAVADLVLAVVDGSVAAGPHDGITRELIEKKHLVVVAKADLPHRREPSAGVWVSAHTREGLDDLRRGIAEALDFEPLHDAPEITNVRHVTLVERVRAALVRAHDAVTDGPLSEEFVLSDLQEARNALEEITGKRASEAVLARIFERFCIGK
jgi:tRNA modification GTPase